MVMHGLAYSANAKRRDSIGDVVSDLALGYCAVLIPDEGAVCFEVKSQNVRGISEPSLEKIGQRAARTPLSRQRAQTPRSSAAASATRG